MAKLKLFSDWELYRIMDIKSDSMESQRLDQLIQERFSRRSPFDNQLINIEIEVMVERIQKKYLQPETLTVEEFLTRLRHEIQESKRKS